MASAPRVWFERLDADHPKLGSALGAATLSLVVGALYLGLAFLRATASDAYLPVLLTTALGLLLALPLLSLGGLLLQTLGQLDLRAWELVAWSWTPAFFTGISLLPAALIVPSAALPAGLLTASVWHLVVLHAGLQIFAPKRRVFALVLYILVVFGLPLALLLYLVVLLSQGPPP